MNQKLTFVLIALASSLSWTLPAMAGQDERTVKGEVIEVQERVRTANDGEFDQLKIRTRRGQELRLQMGRTDTCPGCVQKGDQIRARVRGDGQDGAARVGSMKVRREGSMYSYRFQNGQLAQNQSRLRARDSSGGGRNNQRQWQRGGNGNCRGNGSGSRSPGAGGSGGSRGGGGG